MKFWHYLLFVPSVSAGILCCLMLALGGFVSAHGSATVQAKETRITESVSAGEKGTAIERTYLITYRIEYPREDAGNDVQIAVSKEIFARAAVGQKGWFILYERYPLWIIRNFRLPN